MTEKTTAPVGAPDPFNPDAFRLGQDFAANVGVKKLLTRVLVDKPDRQVFVRVHPDRHLPTMVLYHKEDSKFYLVARDLWDELCGEITRVILYQTIDRQGNVSLWPCRLPGPDG